MVLAKALDQPSVLERPGPWWSLPWAGHRDFLHSSLAL